jgi:hypothetical protein
MEDLAGNSSPEGFRQMLLNSMQEMLGSDSKRRYCIRLAFFRFAVDRNAFDQ